MSKHVKRKPGEKAGLTRADIIAQSLALLEANSTFTIKGVADALGVYPTAVSSYFRGGIDEILTEMVRTRLTNVARPFQPNESWETYFRDLFLAVFAAFHKRPELARLAVSRIAANYYLNPLMVERILVALSVAGVPGTQKVSALDLVMGSLIGMLAVECSGLATIPAAKWLHKLPGTGDGTSFGEYPQINSLKDQLIFAIKARRLHLQFKKPAPGRPQRFADHLIVGLKAQITG